ncbi:MAG TPA: Rne/Rng family ribonuclease, partial [Bryobacteraceae bacterium]|nr:Rne/Rng family ribonuclease [Bryobacteraceae bacterium]
AATPEPETVPVQQEEAPAPVASAPQEAQAGLFELAAEVTTADVTTEPVEEETAAGNEAPAAVAEEEAPEAVEAVGAEGEASDDENAGESAIVEEEGPEPARIPTSLTATLREQGHRYPHRVSRRMRRKMRGQPEDREKNSAAAPAEAKPAETRTVETREERRPERGGRSDRDRSERERPERGDRAERERPERERPALPSISDLLKEGQEIIVQIAKEPLGQKGARITSHIALPGRFVVYMPTVDHAGVSRKIPSDEERQRLKRIVQTHRQGIPGGFICRTAAENKSEEELKSDMHFLYNLWLDMRQKAEKKPAPVLLHHDLDLVQRILRDQLTTSFKTIWVDGEELYESILRFVQRFQPALVSRVKLYTRPTPIFDEFSITNELEKALRPKVWLKSGGYIVINQTEALVAIDINTGKYVGKSNRLEDTIVKINTDAIKEIVRQIRLRDLGGIIVVDFIDMDERKNRQKVMQSLEEAMRADRAPYKILQFNDFGLVAITRKRVKQSLERTLCAPCPYCEGAGYVKSVQTVIGEILQEAHRMRKSLEGEHHNIVLRVNPEVAKVLKSNQNQFLQEIEEMLGRSVLVKSDPLLHQTKFDLA